MNWQAGEGHIQRNTLEKAWWNTTTDYCKLLSDSFQNEEKRHGTMRWQSVEDKRKKKEKEKREEKKKKEREVRKDDNNILSFLSFFFPLPFLILFFFLIFPSFLSVEETGKGKRESQEKERRGRGKEKERKESLLLSSSLALLFLLFIFPSLLSFFLSSLSLASLTRQAWCHMSFFKHSEAVSQKW